MKKQELTKVREKALDKLKLDLDKKRLEILDLRVKITTGQEKDVKKAKKLKKEIAQILTVMREKELVEERKSDK